MKKIFILTFILVLAATGISFANDTGFSAADEGKSIFGASDGGTITGSRNEDTLIGKMSNGVYAGWNTQVLQYVITTTHLQGNKSFGSSFEATSIFRVDTKETAAPTATTQAYFGAGWTAM